MKVLSRRRALLVLAAIVVPSIALGTRFPPAHLYLEAERPKADTVLTSSPPRIVLVFSQEPLTNTTTIRLRDAGGSSHPVSEVSSVGPEDPFTYQATVNGTLPPGKYTVVWHTMSDDEPGGLTRDGSFSFTVAAP